MLVGHQLGSDRLNFSLLELGSGVPEPSLDFSLSPGPDSPKLSSALALGAFSKSAISLRRCSCSSGVGSRFVLELKFLKGSSSSDEIAFEAGALLYFHNLSACMTSKLNFSNQTYGLVRDVLLPTLLECALASSGLLVGAFALHTGSKWVNKYSLGNIYGRNLSLPKSMNDESKQIVL